MSFLSKIESLPHWLASFFGSHQAVIQTVIADTQTAVGAASTIATIAGESKIVPVLSGVSDGLSKVSTLVTAESTATTLAQHAANVTALASGLIQATNDVGVKNADTKAAIGAVLVKVNGVVGALETAAQAATPAA